MRRSLQQDSPCLQPLQPVTGWEEGASEPGRFEQAQATGAKRKDNSLLQILSAGNAKTGRGEQKRADKRGNAAGS